MFAVDGLRLPSNASIEIGVRTGKKYRAKAKDCRVCPVFSRCIKSKNEQSKLKNGKSLLITPSNEENSLSHKMREKLSKLTLLHGREFDNSDNFFDRVGAIWREMGGVLQSGNFYCMAYSQMQLKFFRLFTLLYAAVA